MRRDSIFYQLFLQSPTLLFELLPQPPDRANEYTFDSVLEGDEAKIEARRLVSQAQGSRDIINLLSTIIVYKFSNLSRDEVDAVLGIELQQTRVCREAVAEGETIGEAREQALILRMLKRRVGNVSTDLEARIKTLPLVQLEELGEALLDFSQMADLVAWLDTNRSHSLSAGESQT